MSHSILVEGCCLFLAGAPWKPTISLLHPRSSVSIIVNSAPLDFRADPFHALVRNDSFLPLLPSTQLLPPPTEFVAPLGLKLNPYLSHALSSSILYAGFCFAYVTHNAMRFAAIGLEAASQSLLQFDVRLSNLSVQSLPTFQFSELTASQLAPILPSLALCFGLVIFARILPTITHPTTILLSLLDLSRIFTSHVTLFARIGSKFHTLVLSSMQRFWMLFRGKKWNPLRNRVDTVAQSTAEQSAASVIGLCLVPLLFTLCFFLYLTIAVYCALLSALQLGCYLLTALLLWLALLTAWFTPSALLRPNRHQFQNQIHLAKVDRPTQSQQVHQITPITTSIWRCQERRRFGETWFTTCNGIIANAILSHRYLDPSLLSQALDRLFKAE